ncbi:MAG: OmpA family protein [Deltaproteobacteria bacterium]|nr:OmpA family protein [Deltaproteobacteria bacterium]
MNANEIQPNPVQSERPYAGNTSDRTIVWRKYSNKSVFICGVLFCVVLGLGYYTWNLWSHDQQIVNALRQSKKEIDKLRTTGKQSAAEINKLKQALEQSEHKAFDLDSRLAAAESRFEELQEERASIAARLAEFRKVTQQFRQMISSGKLAVVFRRGRMVVELPEKVLFPSGSADITKDGADALRQVSKVLRRVRDKRFIVAGHTDNVPISNEQFRSNWELSVARAVNVTKSLISSGLNPQRLVAAGHAQFDPVATNSNAAGKQKNRRIEIILEPRLRQPPEAKKAVKTDKTKAVKRKK